MPVRFRAAASNKLSSYRMNNIQKFKSDVILSQLGSYLQKKLDLLLSQNSSLLSSLALLAISAISLFVIFKLFCRLYNLKRVLTEDSVLLEITPPALTEKESLATQNLFSVIHNLGERKTFWDKLLSRKKLISFEIVSTRNLGIRYLVRTTQKEVNNIKKNIISYLPSVRVKIADDFCDNLTEGKAIRSKVVEYKLGRHFAFPLQNHTNLDENDPVAYITGMMTKLKPEELIAFQIVLSPIKAKEVKNLSRMIIRNENILRYLDQYRSPGFVKPLAGVFNVFIKIINTLIREISWGITELVHGSNQKSIYAYQNAFNQNQLRIKELKPERVLSSFEQQVVKSVQGKIDQSLFESSVRLLIKVKSKKELNERIWGFTSSLATYSVPKYQSLHQKYNYLPIVLDHVKHLNFRKRLLSTVSNQSSTLLSVSEVSSLFHFPFASTTQTENIAKVHSKDLPAPLSLKNDRDLDVVFAKNTYGGEETAIGLSKEERPRHTYILGATGTGKSTLMLSMINQDIQNGKGIAVVDPHGELAEAVLACVPKARTGDVIYFNPDDLEYPIGLNLMELTPGLSANDALREKEFIAESIISLFRKVFNDSLSASPHRIEYILRNTIHTAFTLSNPTLFTIYDLLNDPAFRRQAIKNVTDDRLLKFWKNEFGKAGGYQQVKMISPITARIGRFLFSPSAKRILEQPKSTINFDQIMDTKKILICNLAKGRLGEDTAQVLGIMILNKIQLAALKRTRIEASKRVNFYLYVDEFQHFATPSFVGMLSEARKYKLNIVIAEQSTSQQDNSNLTNVILANVGTIVMFKSANPDDEKLILPQFHPYIKKGEISNLPAFHFYIKIGALNPEEPFSGVTIPLDLKDILYIDLVIQSSRDKYAIVYENNDKTAHIETQSSEQKSATKSKEKPFSKQSLPELME